MHDDAPTVRRVVYLDHVARWSGGEIALARLLDALDGRVQAHVILAEPGDLVTALERRGATVEVLPLDRRIRDARREDMRPRRLPVKDALLLARYVVTLRRRLRELAPDLVHTNSLKSAFYGALAARLAGVPVIWHIRDRIADDYLPTPAVRLVRAAARWLPDAVITNSASTLSTLPAGVHGRVVYNNVVADDTPARTATAASGDRPFRIGMVGRLAEWKGQHVFLAAFSRAFPDDASEAWIIGSAVFGEDAYEDHLRTLAATLGIADRVVWRGFRADIASELDEIDVLVHCSITPEPFGQVVVEGMAAGLPVIAARAGGPVEIITDGTDGLLTEPGMVAELADALQYLASSPQARAALGAASARSSRRFGPTAAAAGVEAVYDEVLAMHRRHASSRRARARAVHQDSSQPG